MDSAPIHPTFRLGTWRRTASDPAEWFSAEELDRARDYQRPLTKLRLLRGGWAFALALGFAFGEAGPRLFDALDVTNWVAQLVVYLLALSAVSLVLDVPLDVWVDLVYDRRWGLSTQSARTFVTDQIKSFVLGSVLGALILIPLYAVIRSTDLWWLWGWALVVAFSVLAGFLFPVVIAPIFNRFTPLDDAALAGRVDAVAQRAGVKITGTFVADESRRSRRDNAYVAGLGATRRVVLYDTLLEHPPEVVEQVVAHEIGHWRLHHLRRQIPLAAALALVVFAVLGLAERWDWLVDATGLDPRERFGDPASLPVVALVTQGGFMLTGLVSSWASRAFERQADLEALELLGRPAELIDMHRRLHVKNLADLDPGPLKRLQASHPPAAERMAFAKAWADDRNLSVAMSTSEGGRESDR
ncbi:MAG: M48 family metallopeptidase [Acidimicrobiales bacterium]